MLDPSLRWPQFKLAVELTHVHANVKRDHVRPREKGRGARSDEADAQARPPTRGALAAQGGEEGLRCRRAAVDEGRRPVRVAIVVPYIDTDCLHPTRDGKGREGGREGKGREGKGFLDVERGWGPEGARVWAGQGRAGQRGKRRVLGKYKGEGKEKERREGVGGGGGGGVGRTDGRGMGVAFSFTKKTTVETRIDSRKEKQYDRFLGLKVNAYGKSGGRQCFM
ncbi:hypothetical protein AXG93_1617s1340 [Marchantia polymorpha subsp. ruderalis]|uniref:Uncharacterized protein n=1 Tax=Marchantia polymorpha subsp. ruderalis TaxID=1480154 RepID=A0A176W6U0_MARPO|nr:hypothetical protein AXG93_1617s1340 [Marchantia polymorpha subsp. ruderalis]